MNKEEYMHLEKIDSEKDNLIIAYDLKDRTDRTLLYGYTCDRDTWHVYLQQNHIYTVMYNSKYEPEEINVKRNDFYIPNKRLYPECCDYEFCKLLKEKGVYLPFTTWQDREETKTYYGKIM